MRVKYPRPGQLRLLFMDSDSLAYAVQADDIYKDMGEDSANRYGFSEYHFDHPLCSAMNRKTLGFFKDELNSVPMQQFVGLRPKCYASSTSELDNLHDDKEIDHLQLDWITWQRDYTLDKTWGDSRTSILEAMHVNCTF